MNKKLRVVLISLITAALVLAIAVPALAISPKSELCWINWWGTAKDGSVVGTMVGGTREWSIDGATLTSTCTGTIPEGEEHYGVDKYGRVTLFTFEEFQDRLCRNQEVCIYTDPYYVTFNELPIPAVVQYKSDVLESTFWSLEIEYVDIDPASFTFVSEFDISP